MAYLRRKPARSPATRLNRARRLAKGQSRFEPQESDAIADRSGGDGTRTRLDRNSPPPSGHDVLTFPPGVPMAKKSGAGTRPPKPRTSGQSAETDTKKSLRGETGKTAHLARDTVDPGEFMTGNQ